MQYSRWTRDLVLWLGLFGAVACADNSGDPSVSPGFDAATGSFDSAVADTGTIGVLPDSATSVLDAGASRDAAPAGDTGTPSEAGIVPGNPDGGPVNGFVNQAVKRGTPFDKAKGDTHPSGAASPAGWNWYNIEGGKCRDGSGMGVYVHFGTDPKKLLIYFEGGGACANPGFCDLNPPNVSLQFPSGGESPLTAILLLPFAQAPVNAGVFDLSNAANPFKTWNQIYIPYCTGDVHAGTVPNGKVDGVSEPLNFSGLANTEKIIGRLAATFPETERFVASGSSAGGYAVGIHFGRIQDTFGQGVKGSALIDAAPPFQGADLPDCLQKRWRETWGLDGAYPSDCGEECKNAGGGNLYNIDAYWMRKYPQVKFALISGTHDEIIRLFYGLGNNNCADYPLGPTEQFLTGGGYTAAKYETALQNLRTKFGQNGQFATYYMGAPNDTPHQALFRPRFYEAAAGSGKPTMVAWVTAWLDGKIEHVGP